MSQQPPDPPPAADNERLQIAVDVWKYVVSVQMHFNDIEMKIRSLYFTILAAAVGALGVVQGKHVDIEYLSVRLSLAMLVLLAVIPVSALFYFIDRHWYHRLLQASVIQGGSIEMMYEKALPEIQLGTAISAASPLTFPGRAWRWAFFFVKEKNFKEHGRLHSDAKIEILYKSVMYGAGAICLGYALLKGILIADHPPMFWIVGGIKTGGHWAWERLTNICH